MIQLHPIVRETIATGWFPVKHLSYSSIKEYLTNPRSFLKKYVRYEFDDTSWGTLMVGKSVHKALELYMKTYKESWEILDIDAVIQLGYDQLNVEIKTAQGKCLTKFIQQNEWSFEWPIFKREIEPTELLKLYDQVFEISKMYIEVPADIEKEKRNEFIEFAVKLEQNWLIKFNQDETLDILIEDWKQTIKTCLENFFASGDQIPKLEIHSTEKEEKVFFMDENEEEMPVALKAISDRIDIGDDFCDIFDYKTCGKFNLDDIEKAEYEMQAGANYFTALVATGKTPRKMVYVEILKKNPWFMYALDEQGQPPMGTYTKYDLIAIADKHSISLDRKRMRVFLPSEPDRKLLKPDLETEVFNNAVDLLWEKPTVENLQNALVRVWVLHEEMGVTNSGDEIREKLIDAKLLIPRPWVNLYEINFDERPDIIATFLSIYKGVVNMIAISEMVGVYLPNITAQWGWLEAYQDFKDFESIPKPPVIKKSETITESIQETVAEPMKVVEIVAETPQIPDPIEDDIDIL